MAEQPLDLRKMYAAVIKHRRKRPAKIVKAEATIGKTGAAESCMKRRFNVDDLLRCPEHENVRRRSSLAPDSS